MKRIALLACALFACTVLAARAPALYAQEADDIQSQHENEDPVKKIRPVYPSIQPGDQFIRIALAPVLPISFGNPFGDGQMHLGGMGSLGYHYFFTDSIAVGLDASFGFNGTIGGNIFNYIPILLTATWQPAAGRFQFPLTIGAGFAWETYGSRTYWPGLVIKPQAGVHFRIGQSWTLGADVSYMFMPQFSHLWNKEYDNYYGQFVDVEVVARYYF